MTLTLKQTIEDALALRDYLDTCPPADFSSGTNAILALIVHAAKNDGGLTIKALQEVQHVNDVAGGAAQAILEYLVSKPTIIRAAVLADHRTHKTVYSQGIPARHHNIVQDFKLVEVEHEQGFLTSEGVFVSREEAVKIAVAAGQITLPKKTFPQDELFSEDLW
jgi:hypothetical protein